MNDTQTFTFIAALMVLSFGVGVVVTKFIQRMRAL